VSGVRRACVLALLLAACGGDAGGPLRYDELLTGGAQEGDALPLIVAMHGRGSDPQRFGALAFHGFALRARIALLEAPILEEGGRAWFTFTWGVGGASADARALVPRIQATVEAIQRRRHPTGRPIITGFSQGAMLVYPLLALHPATYGGGVPVSGAILPDEMPATFDGAPIPPVRALHGDVDPIIPAQADTEAVDALKAAGATDASVEIVPGAVHWISGKMRERFQATLEELVARDAAATTPTP
jgi:phospholipase/carboxylesterase